MITERRWPNDRSSTFKEHGKGKLEDRRVSVCTDCKKGIFNNQEYIWTNRGLVHTGCDDATKATT